MCTKTGTRNGVRVCGTRGCHGSYATCFVRWRVPVLCTGRYVATVVRLCNDVAKQKNTKRMGQMTGCHVDINNKLEQTTHHHATNPRNKRQHLRRDLATNCQHGTRPHHQQHDQYQHHDPPQSNLVRPSPTSDRSRCCCIHVRWKVNVAQWRCQRRSAVGHFLTIAR